MIKNCIKYFINSLGVSSYNFETSKQLLSLVFMEFELNIVIKLNDSIRQDWELNDLMDHVEQIFSIRIKRIINLQSNGILDDIITHLYTLSFSTNIRFLTQNFPNSIDNYWSNFKEKEGLVYIEEFEINKSYWDSYEFFLFLGGLLKENMKKSINTNFFQCEVPLKDSFDLEILSSNTKIRRLGYLKLLLKYFNENGRVPVSKTNLDFERYCQSYNEYLSLYKNRKGNIILTKTGNSAAPYIELGISLGLIHKSMGYYELGKIGKVYSVLRKNLRESNGENPFVLSPFEQSFFLENILRQDYFFIYTILELSYVNYSISYLSLKKIFQEKLLSNMDLCIEYAKLNNPGKFLSLRTVKKRISEWNKSESYLEHVLMPRLNWLYDLNIIDLKDDLSFSLTTSGKRLFYNLTIGKDLALHIPAKEQFKNFFEFQQIGSIGDSVDLLIFLYWNSPDFSDKKLERFLHDLFAEYNLSVSNFIKGIDEISESYIKKKNVYKLLREIVDSFYQNEDWLGKVEEVKKKVSSDARLKALFVSCPEERSCKLVDKIKEVQKMMRDFSIYKKDELLSMN